MKAGVIIVCLVVLIIATGFYTGVQVASYTGQVVSEEYQVFDSVVNNAGTEARIVSVVGDTAQVLITLEVKDTILREHLVTFVGILSVAGSEVGRVSEEVVVPYNALKTVVLAIPIEDVTHEELFVRIEGSDDFGTLRLEGMTRVVVRPAQDLTLWWGFGGFFVLLGIIFLVVRHSLTRAKVSSFAQAHSEGLIHIR